MQRDQWGGKLGFILAAIGSAIGLGNIWRYPYVAYENGGGAFLVPYFIALLTAGIPVLILEYSLGTQWGSDPDAFFNGSYLGLTDSFWQIGGIQWKVLLATAIAWAITYWLLRRGVSKGIEIASKILIPTLVIMIIVVVIRGLTLPGATEGLNVLLTPNFSELTNPSVWVAAYGQIFFSIGVGFSIMITYSSYLPRRSDLTNSGFIVALSNTGFEFLAALGVFSVLGFLAVQQNVGVDEVVTQGVGLAFVAFPQIINQLPGLNSFFGLKFFGALFFAGLTSAVSILECGIAGVKEKFGLSRTAAVNWVCGLAALVSLLYATKGGLYYLDAIDHFINNYGLVLSALVEVIFVAWIARQLGVLQGHLNERSYVSAGRWWILALTIITPVLLGIVTAFNLYSELTSRYGDYPLSGLLVFGWGTAILVIVVGFVLQRVRSRGGTATTSETTEREEAR